MFAFIKALRPNQWIKNVIVLAAYLFARWDPGQQSHFEHDHAWLHMLAAMALFCLASSGVYLINDIHDLESDRAHPVKRLRPLAAGAISVAQAWTMAVVLLAVGLAGAWWLAMPFGALLGGYVALQFAYTFRLKKIALLDVFVIAMGFVLRAIGGALAIQVRISPWLLLCTFLLALFLGLCKRRHEKRLLDNDDAQKHRVALVQYDERLLDILIGIAGSATVVAYSLYTLSEETVKRFHTSALGFTIPFVIFGVFRYLDLVYRHEEGGRPEQVLLTDRVMIATVALYTLAVLVIFLTAALGG
jgi:4-hydroxybenzoate polyprenyltransferase